MKKSFFVLSLLTILTSSTFLSAENTQKGEGLSKENILETGAELALKNDLTLSIAETKREITKEALLQAEAARWPTIGLTASSSASFSETKSVQRYSPTVPALRVSLPYRRSEGKKNAIQRQAGAFLEISQPLYTGGSIDANIEAAKLADILEDIRYEDSENASILTTIKTILNVLEARATLKVSLKRKELLERRAEDMQIRADYGLENITSLESTKAKAEAARADFESKKTAVEINEMAYQLLTGTPLPEELDQITPSTLPSSFEELKEMGLKNNFQLREKNILVDIEEQKIEREDAALYPKLSLNASLGKSYTANQNASTDRKIDWRSEKSATFSLKLNIPLDYTGATHSQVRSARYSHAQRKFDELNSRRQYILRLYNFWSNFKTAESNQEKFLAQIKAADLSLEAVQEQYNAGTVGYLNVLEAINEAADANFSYIRNQKAALENAYEILYQTGKLKETFKEKLQKVERPKNPEIPYWETETTNYTAFGWKKDPILDRMKFENQHGRKDA